jgi:hypothetical protein
MQDQLALSQCAAADEVDDHQERDGSYQRHQQAGRAEVALIDAPRAGPSNVRRKPISSSSRGQLPILRQNYRIYAVNDSVRRDQICIHHPGCVDAHIR